VVRELDRARAPHKMSPLGDFVVQRKVVRECSKNKPFKAQRHNHSAQRPHHHAQSQLLLFIPLKARRHNHCARRHNHSVLKPKSPLYLYSFHLKPEGRPIVSKGMSIVSNHYCCPLQLKPKAEGITNCAKRHNHLARGHNHHTITDVHPI